VTSTLSQRQRLKHKHVTVTRLGNSFLYSLFMRKIGRDASWRIEPAVEFIARDEPRGFLSGTQTSHGDSSSCAPFVRGYDGRPGT
jgi:hypothetical protein